MGTTQTNSRNKEGYSKCFRMEKAIRPSAAAFQQHNLWATVQTRAAAILDAKHSLPQPPKLMWSIEQSYPDAARLIGHYEYC